MYEYENQVWHHGWSPTVAADSVAPTCPYVTILFTYVSLHKVSSCQCYIWWYGFVVRSSMWQSYPFSDPMSNQFLVLYLTVALSILKLYVMWPMNYFHRAFVLSIWLLATSILHHNLKYWKAGLINSDTVCGIGCWIKFHGHIWWEGINYWPADGADRIYWHWMVYSGFVLAQPCLCSSLCVVLCCATRVVVCANKCS